MSQVIDEVQREREDLYELKEKLEERDSTIKTMEMHLKEAEGDFAAAKAGYSYMFITLPHPCMHNICNNSTLDICSHAYHTACTAKKTNE